MARIDQEEIDRIKRETDIVALIQSSGTTLKRRESKRGEWIGCCPVHDDKDCYGPNCGRIFGRIETVEI